MTGTGGDAPYTHGHHDPCCAATPAHGEELPAYLLPDLRPGMAVLDVRLRTGHDHYGPGRAGGPRRWSRWTARRPSWSSRRYAAEAGYADRIDFAVADVHELEFPDDTFDFGTRPRCAARVRSIGTAARCGGCAGGRIVAARDSDYSGSSGTPNCPRWTPGAAVPGPGRANGGEPDAGRRCWPGRTSRVRGRRGLVLGWCYAGSGPAVWGSLWRTG